MNIRSPNTRAYRFGFSSIQSNSLLLVVNFDFAFFSLHYSILVSSCFFLGCRADRSQFRFDFVESITAEYEKKIKFRLCITDNTEMYQRKISPADKMTQSYLSLSLSMDDR